MRLGLCNFSCDGFEFDVVFELRTTFYWLATWITNGNKGVSELPDYLLLVCGLVGHWKKGCPNYRTAFYCSEAWLGGAGASVGGCGEGGASACECAGGAGRGRGCP